MPARLPVQNQSPFEIDARPRNETARPHAGLLAPARAFPSLKVPARIAANLSLKQRHRGFSEGQHFAVNAAWFKLALLAYNVASAIKGLCFSPAERTARFKKYRLLLVPLAGRMSRFQCKLRLRFCASVAAIQRVQRVWAVFALPTQATAFT